MLLMMQCIASLHRHFQRTNYIMDPTTLKASAIETMYKVAQATDDLDIPLLESLFMPDQSVMVDVSGHLGLPPQDVMPPQLAQQMIQAISGFTATHHVITNPIVTLEIGSPIKAKAVALKTAYHCIQGDDEMQSATARGKWDMQMEQADGQWAITHFTVVRTVPLLPSELSLWDVARARVKESKGRVAKS
ncbi:hypothetical protein VHEMI04556 [[Torrubiella] hemipterigena]|uniref:SnoaL-like domain-containing protein n=1 Tax=[Torrubiella] hemipterigena TaxID=1531966 RepID=A0A0A1TES6_9HYPO|nr:hypothetical protein VHEMI04556 [[Torrubiella] hemipterigena]